MFLRSPQAKQVAVGSFKHLPLGMGVLVELWWPSQTMNCQNGSMKGYDGSCLMYVCPVKWRLLVQLIGRQTNADCGGSVNSLVETACTSFR